VKASDLILSKRTSIVKSRHPRPDNEKTGAAGSGGGGALPGRGARGPCGSRRFEGFMRSWWRHLTEALSLADERAVRAESRDGRLKSGGRMRDGCAGETAPAFERADLRLRATGRLLVLSAISPQGRCRARVRRELKIWCLSSRFRARTDRGRGDLVLPRARAWDEGRWRPGRRPAAGSRDRANPRAGPQTPRPDRAAPARPDPARGRIRSPTRSRMTGATRRSDGAQHGRRLGVWTIPPEVRWHLMGRQAAVDRARPRRRSDVRGGRCRPA
jgi:hypothetical protein